MIRGLRIQRPAVLITLTILTLAPTAHAAPPTRAQNPAWVADRVKTILDQLEADGALQARAADIIGLFDQVIAYSPTQDAAAFRDAAYLLRLARLLEPLDAQQRRDLLASLRQNDDLARTLVFLVDGSEKPQQILNVLTQLREAAPDKLNTYANLAAAICVVHDRPVRHRVNENTVTAESPAAIFDFYSTNESRMLFGVKNVPAELLIYVVDNAADESERRWALQKYMRRPNVGELFFDIEYDYDHLKGAEKKVTAAGFNLPNILKYGGVCADQAYFAVAVGKSIGIPAVYTRAASGDTSHAWVGFLQQRGRQATWNFDSGRYEAYKAVKGTVIDPQTGEWIPDSIVALQAEMIGSRAADRQTAAALTDAAWRMVELSATSSEFNPPPPTEGAAAVRQIDVDSIDAMIEAALKQNVGYVPAWLAVRYMAENRRYSVRQIGTWWTRIDRLCGVKYADFSLAMLVPMIAAIEDVTEQNRLWESAFSMFLRKARRLDLAAEVRMHQAEMWRAADEPAKAGRCYEDVINQFTNAGPFVIDALVQTERMLNETNQARKIPLLYGQTWRRLERPKATAPEFFTQSNWFKVGVMYAGVLAETGGDSESAIIYRELDKASGTDSKQWAAKHNLRKPS